MSKKSFKAFIEEVKQANCIKDVAEEEGVVLVAKGLTSLPELMRVLKQ